MPYRAAAERIVKAAMRRIPLRLKHSSACNYCRIDDAVGMWEDGSLACSWCLEDLADDKARIEYVSRHNALLMEKVQKGEDYVSRHNARGVNPDFPGYKPSPSRDTRRRNTVSGGLPGLGKRA